MPLRSPLPLLPLLPLLLTAPPAAHAQPRVAFPSSTIAGYARTIRGEELVYHSPMPWVDKSLLVRSLDRGMDIVWETAPVPIGFTGDTAVFAFALGIDVTDTTRHFDFFVDGDSALTFSSPPVAALGTHDWEGRGGIRIVFRATLVDKYGDLMGYAFLHVPRARLSPGRPLTLRVAGESQGKRTWFMVFKEPLAEGVILRNAPALIRSPSGNRQVIRVDLLTLDEERRFRMSGPIGTIDTTVGMGHTRFQLPIPAVQRDADVALALRLGDRPAEATFTIATVTPLEVHLIHHTHLDIGYTEYQDSVERRHWSHLREAMRLGAASASAAAGERFVWNPEGLWAVESYLAAHPADSAAFRDAVRQGWIVLDAMFANLLTGMASTEGLGHALDAKRRLERFTGVPIVSAMQSDIPGATWGLVSLFAGNGVRYFSVGPNQGHRIGHFTKALGDRPFWWVSADGADSVLTWSHGAGYSLFHTGLGYTNLRRALDEENIFRYLDQLAVSAYPYDLTVLRYNIGSDNGPPDPLLPEAVRAWNERYAAPRLVISSVPQAFRAFEAKYGASLPALRGDLTGHWEDGVQSTARETAEVRRTAEALQQTGDLAALWGAELPADTLALAWKHVLLYYEHTWGAWNSIGEPEVAPVLAQWARKQSFADSAALLAGRLRDGLLSQRRPRGPSGTIEVWNTTSEARTDLVVLPAGAAVRDDRGRDVPSQILRDGRLAFLARDVPAGGHRSYRVREGSARRPLAVIGTSLETERFSVTVDPRRGRIASVVDKVTGRELVEQGDGGGLAVYTYVPGRDPSRAVLAAAGTMVAGQNGPLVRSLVWRAAAPGTDGIETEVVLVEGLPRVEIVVRLDKRLVYDPEAVLYRFAFAIEPDAVRIGIPGGSFALEREQLPGANRNYFNARSWIELRPGTDDDDAHNVVLTTLDVPMLQVGALGSDPIVTGWRERAEPSGTVWSYVMNNYWETNYRAGQNGPFEARYFVMSGVEPEAAARAVTRPLVVVR